MSTPAPPPPPPENENPGGTPPPPPPGDYGQGITPPPPPPPPGAYGQGGFVVPPPPPPGYGQVGGYPGQRPIGTNALAIASMSAGIASLVLFCCYLGFVAGPAAIVLAIFAKKQIATTGQNGSTMATAGLIMGIVSVALSVLGVVFWIVMTILGNSTSFYRY